jgi:energy-coupling factor transport system ATP-binding protein
VRVSCSSLKYSYDLHTTFEKMALQLSDFEMELPGITGIVGPTGSGKTTFCKLLAGIYEPQFGGLSIEPEGSVISYVFQQPEHQIFEETVEAELQFAMKNFGVPMDDWDQRIFCALRDVNLEKIPLDTYPGELSGGMKRRLAIASLLVLRPNLLILDEPLAGVDPQSAQVLVHSFQRLVSKEGMCILWVCHEIKDMLLYMDKLLCFRDGEVVAQGSPYDVLPHSGYVLPPYFSELKNKMIKDCRLSSFSRDELLSISSKV